MELVVIQLQEKEEQKCKEKTDEPQGTGECETTDKKECEMTDKQDVNKEDETELKEQQGSHMALCRAVQCYYHHRFT